jgi:hypothetical protein
LKWFGKLIRKSTRATTPEAAKKAEAQLRRNLGNVYAKTLGKSEAGTAGAELALLKDLNHFKQLSVDRAAQQHGIVPVPERLRKARDKRLAKKLGIKLD